MANYILTNKAIEDLSEIWNYTFEVWSENQADKYYNLIVVSFGEIAENPMRGKKYKEVSEELMGLNVGKHIIFYQQLNPGIIQVVRILHERIDLKSRLND